MQRPMQRLNSTYITINKVLYCKQEKAYIKVSIIGRHNQNQYQICYHINNTKPFEAHVFKRLTWNVVNKESKRTLQQKLG